MILEYIEGVNLATIVLDDDKKRKILAAIEQLHAHNMVMGDICESNFILALDEIRIIDCSGKSATKLRKAEDRVNMCSRLGIPTFMDFYYHLVVFKQNLKSCIRLFKRKLISWV